MGTSNQPADLLSLIKELQKQVRELRRRSLFGAAISEGDLSVRTSDGSTVLRVGEIPYGSGTVSGLAITRADGTLQARFFDTSPGGGGYWALFDEQQNVIVSEDTVASQGLATPYLQVKSMPSSEVTTVPQFTTSATFVPLHRLHFQKAQPWIRTWLITQTDAATVGEVRLAVGGVAITAAPLPLAAAINTYQLLDAPVAGSHMSFQAIDVEARRVSGAGNVRVGVAFASGRQS